MTENGGLRPTIRTVAELAGVSTATVSYVLAGRSGGRSSTGVSTATAEKVRAAVASLGYVPNAAARTIRTGRSNVVLLSLTVLSDPWALGVIEAVRRHTEGTDLTPMIMADVDWARVLPRQQADVVFIDSTDTRSGDPTILRELAARGHRIVAMSGSTSLRPDGFDVVRTLPIPGCDLVMAHLLRRHRTIGCLAMQNSPATGARSRYGSYLRALKKAGIAKRDDHVAMMEPDALSAYNAAMKLLTLPDRPTAIFAVSDFAAIAAINAAQRLGLTVGRDIDIAGAGNTVEGERMSPSLTSTGPIDFYDRLAALLVDRAESPRTTAGEVFDFPWQLLVRESAP